MTVIRQRHRLTYLWLRFRLSTPSRWWLRPGGAGSSGMHLVVGLEGRGGSESFSLGREAESTHRTYYAVNGCLVNFNFAYRE